ncbi:hypothetical protein Trydic_g639 [Trypoxylus dichotomus]
MVSNNTNNWADDKDSFLEDDATSLRRINHAVTAKVSTSENSEEVCEILGAIKAEKRAIDALKNQVKNMSAIKNAKKKALKKK